MKNELLDKAVVELDGVFPDSSQSDTHNIDLSSINVGHYFSANDCLFVRTLPVFGFVCSAAQFTQRAKELGFINGYRWGVEYQTDGKRPELADDVEVEITQHDGFVMCHQCRYIRFEHVAEFKITDQRYKPADTSYLDKPESSTHSAESSRDNDADWYDHDNQKALRLPPVGTECQYALNGGSIYWDCEVISHHRLVIKCPHLAGDSGEGLQVIGCDIEFRPLDHATRKAELERQSEKESLKEQLMSVVEKIDYDHDLFREVLSEIGYLRQAEGDSSLNKAEAEKKRVDGWQPPSGLFGTGYLRMPFNKY